MVALWRFHRNVALMVEVVVPVYALINYAISNKTITKPLGGPLESPRKPPGGFIEM